jgi:hypothetical protein
MTRRRILNALLSTTACAACALTLPAAASQHSLVLPAGTAASVTETVIETAIVGRWDIVSFADVPIEEDGYSFTFNADGTGAFDDGGLEPEPLVYSYDAEADLYTLQIEQEDIITFRMTFDGDEATLTPVPENPAYPPLGLRRAESSDAE